jgi:hypothetical protein
MMKRLTPFVPWFTVLGLVIAFGFERVRVDRRTTDLLNQLHGVQQQIHDAPVVAVADGSGGHKLGSSIAYGGDLGGSTNVAQYVQSMSGNAGGGGTVTLNASPIQWAKGIASPTVTQSAPTTDVATNTVKLQGQYAYSGASTNTTAGNIVLDVGAPAGSGTTEASVQITRNGTAIAQIGAIATIPTYAGLWLGSTAPTSSNWAIRSDSSGSTYLNAPAGTAIGLLTGASTFQFYIASSIAYIGGSTAAAPMVATWSTATTPLLQSGTSATSFTVGTNNPAGILNLQGQSATTYVQIGGNGLAPGVGTQSCSAGGSITPTAAVLGNPYIKLTGSMPSNTTIVLPNAVGMWWFDVSALTFSAHTLGFSSGSGNTATISSVATTAEIVQVFTGGSNYIVQNI